MSSRQIQEVKSKLKKFQKILNLNNEKINLIAKTNGYSATSKNNGTWEIEYNIQNPIYELIHELGHIFLYNKTNYIYFAVPPDNIKRSIFKDQKLLLLFNYCNSLVDCLVDYKISVYNIFYGLYFKYLEHILEGIIQKTSQLKSEQILEGYLKFYPSFKEILRMVEKKKMKRKISSALDLLSQTIINKSSSYNKDIFRNLAMSLDEFKNFKKSNDHVYILSFIKSVIEKLPDFDKSYLNTHFQLIFPI